MGEVPLSTDVSVPSIRLFPFQREAQKAIDAAFARGIRKVLVSIPTGGGKTVTVLDYFARILRYYKGRGREEKAIWVVHREELVEQARETWAKVAPDMTSSIWNADHKDTSGDLVIAMVMSCKKLRGKFVIVGIDEAHHAAVADDGEEGDYEGNSYTRLIQQLTWSRVVGCSATLDRLDGRSLDFEEVVYSKSLLDLVKIGRLSRPIYMESETNERYDLQMRGGEYTGRSLLKLNNPKRNKHIVDIWMRNRERFGKTIMYVTGVQHCYDMMEEFQKVDPTLEIALVTGDCEKKYRRQLTDWFAEGDWTAQKILINCAVLTEGFDEPTVNTIFLARPTASKTLWLQCAGRGARIVYSYAEADPGSWQELEQVGDDGVKRLRLPDGIEKVGEDLGLLPNGKHRLRLQEHNEFYIVNVMDDITKYASMCEEWQTSIRDLEPEELEEIKEIESLRQQTLRIKKIEEEKQVEYAEPEYSREQIRDVIGILRIATYYTKRLGFPIDSDRYKALQRLAAYRDSCWTVTQSKTHNEDGSVTVGPETEHFDKAKFEESFVHCCVRGEFSWRWWERIRIACYLRYVVNRETVVCQTDGSLQQTWEYIPVVDMTADSRKDVVAEAMKEFEEAKIANEEFNAEYADVQRRNDLFDDIVARTKDRLRQADDPKRRRSNTRLINNYMNSLVLDRAYDRKLCVVLRREIEGPQQAAEMSRVREHLSATMREVLDDPSCIVTVQPLAFKYDDTRVG